MTKRHSFIAGVFVSLLFPALAFAHQPRLVEGSAIVVDQPEISKAYYGTLAGDPHVYRFRADAPFDLYVNILVPDITGQKKDVSVAIIKDGDTAAPLAVLDGVNGEWKQFWEPFGHDSYWQGPEYKARAEAGEYEIRVWSSNNDSKYVLAIGEIEAFDLKESANAVMLIPGLKRDFFEKSPADFILSPFGAVYLALMYLLAFALGLLYRFAMARYAAGTVRGARKNIGTPDRSLRAAIGLALLIWAITTSWDPILLLLSGFTIFEAAFSWCGLYAAIGKNTCPAG